MSKLAHSAEWVVLFLDSKGYYPALRLACVSGMGSTVRSGLMYPDAHIVADELNQLDGIEGPQYTPMEEP